MAKKLNLKYVSDVVKDDYLNWQEGDVVTLQSQTGTGKTRFIFNVILPTIKEDERMLFISNRRKLSRDTKRSLIKQLNLPSPDTIEELDKMERFGNVRIITYQLLGTLLKSDRIDLNFYKWIVCDEMHFWLTDASFNNKNHLSFDKIMRNQFPNSIRIYMSATMHEFNKIIEGSKEFYKQLHKYDSGRDYTYLDVSYFKKMDDILQLIKNDKSIDKWMIFVTSKEKGKQYEEELLAHGIDAVFVHAKSKEDYIINEKFQQKVFIATKFLDNGINVTDDEVKHLVVNAWDQTTFLQEIGRVRIDNHAARTVKLYIPTYSIKSFTTLLNGRYKHLGKQVKFFNEDEEKFTQHYKDDHHKVSPIIFRLDDDNKWRINVLGYIRSREDVRFAQKMVKDFIDDNGNKDGFAYVKQQLEWLGLQETFNEINLIEKVIDINEINEMSEFLERLYVNKIRISGQLKEDVINRIDLRVEGKQLKSYAKLNYALKELLSLPYTIHSKKSGNSRYWIIEKDE